MLIATGIAGYVWLKLQDITQKVTNVSEVIIDEFVQSEDTPVANEVPEDGMYIDSSEVTPRQKAMAETIGLDLDAVTITPEMVACGEVKLGSERISEIINGDSPGPLEAISLLGCL